MIKKYTILVIILVLLAGNVFFASHYFVFKKELSAAREDLQIKKINEQILNFSKMFVNEVLMAETEIDFETRLKLENDVRSLADEEILAQWQNFVSSQNENQAQEEVKNLLKLLLGKIETQ